MLIWINGAFGAGKTQTAFELHRRVPGSHVADPELIGYGIHAMLPPSARDDFQNRPQWRTAVVATLADAVAAADGPVIVPMTLVEPAYFDEIMGGLRDVGVNVMHCALLATPDTLRRRLRTRSGYWLGRAVGREDTWAMEQIDRCVSALSTSRFAHHIGTDDITINEVVEAVAEHAGIELTVPRMSSARYQLRRARIGLAHIRW